MKGLIGFRNAFAGVLALALLAYVATVVTGAIPSGQKLGLADLALIVAGSLAIALVLRPQLLNRIAVFRLGSLEIELQKVQRVTENQGEDLQSAKEVLNGVRIALELALTKEERDHLLNLQSTPPPLEYEGHDRLKTELRRLRALGLIRSKRYIAEIPNGGRFDLHDYVELTDRGRDYLKGILEET